MGSRMPRAYPALATPEKAIAAFSGWSDPEPNGYIRFAAPIEIEGVVEPGLFLHGGCYIDRPDCGITFELHLEKNLARGVRRCVPLVRIDWRALSGGHTNQRRYGGRGNRCSDSHVHEFDLNWDADNGRLRGANLPLARDIETQLHDFKAVREYAGNLLKISNIDVVVEPHWEYVLALEGGANDAH
jgi:hypothetical protein